jgi:hypothetical protein
MKVAQVGHGGSDLLHQRGRFVESPGADEQFGQVKASRGPVAGLPIRRFCSAKVLLPHGGPSDQNPAILLQRPLNYLGSLPQVFDRLRQAAEPGKANTPADL